MVKLTRWMIFWISLYFAEKIFQDTFVRKVLTENDEPPDARLIVPCALGIDFLAMTMVGAVCYLLSELYKTGTNSFVIDAELIGLAAYDYAVSSSVMLGMGVLLGHAVQNDSILRYRDMGMRGIRAFCEMMLYVSFFVFAIPYYRLY